MGRQERSVRAHIQCFVAVHPQFRILKCTHDIPEWFEIIAGTHVSGPAAMNALDHFGIQPATSHEKEDSTLRLAGIEANEGAMGNGFGKVLRDCLEMTMASQEVLVASGK